MARGKARAAGARPIPGTSAGPPRVGTVEDVLLQLAPNCFSSSDHLRWPADAFVLAAYVLRASGAYVHVIKDWPPRHGKNWVTRMRAIGADWRRRAGRGQPPPRDVEQLWSQIAARRHQPLRSLKTDDVVAVELSHTLLELVAAADEACVGAGLPTAKPDRFLRKADEILLDSLSGDDGSTLSPLIPPALARALPKQHTPRGGLTLRSLTHHLALHVGCDVTPKWLTIPSPTAREVNLVIVPWPLELERKQFRAASGNLQNMPAKFQFLATDLKDRPTEVAECTRLLVDEAKKICRRVDGVVFPEISLTPGELDAAWREIGKENAFLVAGVLKPGAAGQPATNEVVIRMPLAGGAQVTNEQKKHHRWRLDRAQIENYGLDGVLDASKDWWEYIQIGRDLHFHPLNHEVTFCCLICEDLARIEPVGELIRSVGPNLVIALLMDAPQLSARWPARYATVLAEDPGSSVLTVTSAGMVDLSSPPTGSPRRRTIALWKDMSRVVEIDLPDDSSGALLRLSLTAEEEFSADGRSDHGASMIPKLTSWRPLRPRRH